MTTFSIDEFYKKIKEFPWIDIEYPTHKYAIEVVTGERVACKWEKLSETVTYCVKNLDN